MSLAGGLSAQFGMVDETTYNTLVTVTRFLEFNSETLKRSIERIESTGLRPTRRVVREKQVQAGREAVNGDVEFDVNTMGFGLLLKHMLGAITSSQPNVGSNPTVWEHLGEVGALDARSFTAQIARGDVGGTIRAFTYGGCKVPKWELICDEKGFLKLKLSVVGASESLAEGLATAAYAAEAVPLVYTGAVFKSAGTEILLKKFSLMGDNKLATRYAMKATTPQQQRAPLEGAGIREYTGKAVMEFESLVQYERFVNKEVGELTAFFSGPTISGAYKNAMEVTLPAVRYDGETPTVPGPQLIDQTLPFKVLDSGVAKGPVQIKYRTTDTAP